MYGASLTYDAHDVLDELEVTAADAPKRVSRAFDREVIALSTPILAEVQREPAPAKQYYKLPWASRRQQIYVIAMLRRQGNLPYRRTHRLIRSWRVIFKPRGGGAVGELELSNEAPEARWVVGDDTQPMFLKIPWVQGAPVVAKYRPVVTDRLIDLWGRLAL